MRAGGRPAGRVFLASALTQLHDRRPSDARQTLVRRSSDARQTPIFYKENAHTR